jgi:hypothetical protein
MMRAYPNRPNRVLTLAIPRPPTSNRLRRPLILVRALSSRNTNSIHNMEGTTNSTVATKITAKSMASKAATLNTITAINSRTVSKLIQINSKQYQTSNSLP